MSRGNKTRQDKNKAAHKERVRFIDESRQVSKTLRRMRLAVERHMAETTNDIEHTAENVDMVVKLVNACSRGLEVEIKASDMVRKRQDEERRLMDDQRLRQLLVRAAKDNGFIHLSEAAKSLKDYLVQIPGLELEADKIVDKIYPGHNQTAVINLRILRRRVLETMDNEQKDLLDMADDLANQVQEIQEMTGDIIDVEESGQMKDGNPTDPVDPDPSGTIH